MYSQHVITAEEHRQWFERVRHDESQYTLIFVVDAEAQGYINFKRLQSATIADWGFYLSPDAPAGTGSQLGRTALQYAFNTLKLCKVCGQALGFNEKSIRFHQRLGFQIEGVLREQYFDGEHYHDIVCFGLLSSEWEGEK